MQRLSLLNLVLLFINLCTASIYAADTVTEITVGFDLNKVAIELLQHHPEHIDALCKMWHDVAGKKSYPDFDAVKVPYTEVLKNQMKVDELPLALIALLDGEPIGLCALRPTCIPKEGVVPWSDQNPDKKPWFAAFVATAFQKQGVGTKLIRKTMHHAQVTFGFNKAYVVPEDAAIEALYLRKGCTKIADTTLRGKPASVLEIELTEFTKKLISMQGSLSNDATNSYFEGIYATESGYAIF